MPNPVVRWQILSPEPDQAAGFYQKLFAWKLSQANALGYRELLSGSAKSRFVTSNIRHPLES